MDSLQDVYADEFHESSNVEVSIERLGNLLVLEFHTSVYLFLWILYRPSSKPSLKPTKGPKTKRPTPKPTAAKTSAPTLRPISMNSSPTGLGGVVYYPDIYLGVCKSDGNYGDIPYKFSSAEACCKNNYMDYFKCMAYASPKKYFPNPWKGYCEEADSTENSLYIYTTAEECCQSGMVGEYDACVLNTRNQSGPVSTKPPTRSPNSSSTPGNYYPDFSKLDTVVKVCRCNVIYLP